MRSIDPNSRASACAAVGPTCRIDNATSTFHNGRSLATSRLASSFRAFADNSPALVRKSSTSARLSSFRSKTSPSSAITRASSSAAAASYPSTSMSKAPRPARLNKRSRSCAGQKRLFGQRMSLSPSFW
jgi:hypothetical protein